MNMKVILALLAGFAAGWIVASSRSAAAIRNGGGRAPIDFKGLLTVPALR